MEPISKQPLELTPTQSRAARSLLSWTSRDLAAAADIHVNTVCRFESGSKHHRGTATLIIRAFEENGIEFIEDGVRLKSNEVAKGNM